MKFVQLIEWNTPRISDISRKYQQWAESIKDVVVTPVVTSDTDSENWIIVMVMYETYNDALAVSDMDVTKRLYKNLEEITDDGPFYRHLEVVE